MLSILRQMSLEELRYAAAACGSGTEPTPEGILRALCRECGILGWGFVPLNREDALLEQVAQRLGVPTGPRGPRGVSSLERRVFATLLRRAWEAADPSYQRSLLQTAASLWDTDAASTPELPPHEEPTALGASLDAFLARTGGLRALAAATESVPLIFPPLAHGSLLEQFAGFGPVTVLRTRSDRGYPALFEVLKLCWRARYRLLAERRAQQQQLERQLRHLGTSMQQRVSDLRGATAPWGRHWVRGLSVAGGALAATGAQWAWLGITHPVGWLLLTAGLTWSAATWAARPRVEEDPRYARLEAEVNATRQQLAAVQHAIQALETG